MENLVSLNPKIVCPIIAKEVQDFQKQTTLIQKVLQGISARENCIKQIEEYSRVEFKENALIT